MSRIGVTYQQVIEAANQIWSRSENPTIERVRRALGDRGSNSTIARYLNDWRAASRASNSPIVSAAPALHSFPDPISAAISQIWEKIQAEVAEERHKMQENTQLAITALENALVESKRLAEERAEQLNELRLALQSEREVIRKLESGLRQLEAEVRSV